MPCALYVSPHLDDAVLSCGGGILERVGRGARVVVATVFSHGDETLHARRRAEDERALTAAGAEWIHLGLLDAPWRGIAGDFDGLTGTETDAALVERVREIVRELVAKLDPEEVWLPAAIGGHVDHRTVHEARGAAGDRARLYADRPYAFVEPLAWLRRAEVEGTALDVSADALRGAIARAGVMESFVGRAVPTLHARLAARRAKAGVSLETRRHRFPLETLPRACALVDAYASQLETLFGASSCEPTYARLATEPDAWFEDEVVPIGRSAREGPPQAHGA